MKRAVLCAVLVACGGSAGVAAPLVHQAPVFPADDAGGASDASGSPTFGAATPDAGALDAARAAQLGDPCDPDGGDPCPGAFPGTLAVPLFCETWGPQGSPILSACSILCNDTNGPCAADAGACIVDALGPEGLMCVPANWCAEPGGCEPSRPDAG